MSLALKPTRVSHPPLLNTQYTIKTNIAIKDVKTIYTAFKNPTKNFHLDFKLISTCYTFPIYMYSITSHYNLMQSKQSNSATSLEDIGGWNLVHVC